MATENRTIRIEDWQGNTYLPETDSGTSTAGSISGADSASTDPSSEATGTYTQGTVIADPSANGGTAIYAQASNTNQIVYSTCVSSVSFGTLSISIRLKSNIATGTSALLRVNTYFVDNSGTDPQFTLLDSQDINGNDIGIANEYVTLGLTTQYEGVATGATLLKVQVVLLPNTGCNIYFDQLAVAMALPSSGSNYYAEEKTEGADTFIIAVFP